MAMFSPIFRKLSDAQLIAVYIALYKLVYTGPHTSVYFLARSVALSAVQREMVRRDIDGDHGVGRSLREAAPGDTSGN